MAITYANGGFADINASWQRTYDERLPNWLITLGVYPTNAVSGLAFPQTRAVVDDFGTLVIVRAWQ